MELKELELIKHEMNVSKESIEYIKEVIKKNKIKKVLEIGCFNGYSALNFASVAREVKTIEIDKRVIEIAKKNFKFYKFNNIEILEDDAKEILSNLNEKFDLIFIDAMKKEYKDYLVLSLKLINKKGFIFADNTISHKEHMKDFFDYLEKSKLKWKETNLGKGLVEIKI